MATNGGVLMAKEFGLICRFRVPLLFISEELILRQCRKKDCSFSAMNGRFTTIFRLMKNYFVATAAILRKSHGQKTECGFIYFVPKQIPFIQKNWLICDIKNIVD